MNSHLSVVLAVSLLTATIGAPLAEAQSCGSVATQETGYSGPMSCESLPPTQPISMSLSWSVSGSTSCSGAYFGSLWYPNAQTGSAGSLNVTASGQCGCPPSIGSPSVGQDGEHFDAQVTSATNCSYSGGNCTCVPQVTGVHVYTAATCTSGFCCSTSDLCTQGGDRWDASTCSCAFSPLLLDLTGDGLVLSSASDGVVFDLRPGGTLERVAWPTSPASTPFVVDDVNGDGQINDGGELLGSASPQSTVGERNGFNALGLYDTNGDGVVTSEDSRFSRLLLWFDSNRDGRSQPSELRTLSSAGVTLLSLRYQEINQRDSHGNIIAYRSRAFATNGGRRGVRRLWLYDVFLRDESANCIPSGSD